MTSSAPCILAVEGGHIDLCRALRLVWMFCSGVDAQIPELLAGKRPARQHALDSLLQHPLGVLALENLRGRPLLDAAGISSMPVIDLVAAFLAGEHDLIGIDDDDIVAAIHMRGEARLVLASEPHGDERREPAHDEAVGIDEDPGFVDVLWCR